MGPIPIGLGAATDLFCAAKAAEGSSPRTVEWYRMILVRAVRRFGEARPVDAIPAAELRAWLLELRASLAPESVAGYVRGLKAFGNWCAAEELAVASGFRALRRPKVPHRLIAPFSDPELRSLLALADERERALALVLLDTGLRLSELTSLLTHSGFVLSLDICASCERAVEEPRLCHLKWAETLSSSLPATPGMDRSRFVIAGLAWGVPDGR